MTTEPMTGLAQGRLTPRGGCRVQCRRGSSDLGPDLALRLVDVWPDGATVLVREPLPEGQEVSLVLEGPGNCHPVRHAGQVARAAADAAGGHLAVVEFRERIPRAELMRLT